MLAENTTEIKRCKPLLGTYVELTLRAHTKQASRKQLLKLSEHCFNAIKKVQGSMNFHDVNSELSLINRTALTNTVVLSDPINQVLKLVEHLYHTSKGAFDPTVSHRSMYLDKFSKSTNSISNAGDRHLNVERFEDFGTWRDVSLNDNCIKFERPVAIDLGGVAKGFAVDQALACCPPEVDIIVNAGGDIGMSNWRNQNIGIRYSIDEVAETKMLNRCVASSADYFKKTSAIVDPVSLSVKKSHNCYSVFAKTCMIADALTKLAYLNKLPRNLANHYQATICSINRFGTIKHSSPTRFFVPNVVEH